jgi:hypothetical protein
LPFCPQAAEYRELHGSSEHEDVSDGGYRQSSPPAGQWPLAAAFASGLPARERSLSFMRMLTT